MGNIVEPVIYNTFPIEIQAYFIEAAVTVVKKTARSSVYHMKNQSHDVFLKVTPKEQMQREAIMTSYLHHKGICPNVLHYSSNDINDYLVTERIPGSHSASDEYIAHPEHLCDVFGESLLHLHQIAHTDCPVTNGLEEMFIRAERKYQEGKAEKSLLQYMGYTSSETAYKDMVFLYKHAIEDKVIIHGDYCLPNLILQNNKRNGYIDVGYGGVGDRHYDIFWGLWSLQFNLKSADYANRFMKAYGQHVIDQNRLRLCGLLSVFNGFRGQDYYES